MTANVNGLAAVIARIPDMEAIAEPLKHDSPPRLTTGRCLFFGIFGAFHHVRQPDRLVGAVAGAARLLGIPDVTSWSPRRRRAGRRRCPRGCATYASAIPAPPTTRSAGDVERRSGEHLAVTGANGSGKTTLMLLLAGREPTSGTVERPGAVGLGPLGGTAVVMQHPESQVLGTRVADDVVWGLPPGQTTDVPGCSTRSAWTGWPSATPAGCPVANCSAWQSQRRWHASRRC